MNKITNVNYSLQSCCLFYNIKPPKKLKNENLTDLVENITRLIAAPDKVLVAADLDIQHLFHCKMNELIKNYSYLHKKIKNEYSLYTSYHFDDLIKKVLHILTEETGDQFIKGRALKTLSILQNANPELETLYAIANQARYKPKEQRYKITLQKFQKRRIFCHPVPIVPHTVSQISKALQNLDFLPRDNQVIKESSYNQQEIDFFTHQAILYGVTNPQDDFFNNLLTIGKLEGISVNTVSKNIIWLRDYFIFNEETETLLIPSEIVESNQFHIRLIAQEITGSNILLGAVAEKSVEEAFKQAKIQHKKTPFYFEGGDCIPAIDASGKKCYLVGAGCILFSLLNAGTTFLSGAIKTKLINKLKKFDQNTHTEQVARIFNKLKQTDFFGHGFNDENLNIVSRLMIVGSECVVEMMERHFGCKVIVLGDVFEGAPGFHLDTFLLPIPGKFLIQDDELSMAILETTLKTCDLTSQERARLEIYYREAKFYHQRDRDKYNLIKEQLKKANFTVVPVPGIYHSTSRGYAINYINAIAGIGKNGTYCITNGSPHSADRFLQDVFTTSLHALGIKQVYYAGKREIVSAGEADFYRSATDSLQKSGGVHCRTQTLHRPANIFKPAEISNENQEDVDEEENISPFDIASYELYNELIEQYNSTKR